MPDLCPYIQSRNISPRTAFLLVLHMLNSQTLMWGTEDRQNSLNDHFPNPSASELETEPSVYLPNQFWTRLDNAAGKVCPWWLNSLLPTSISSGLRLHTVSMNFTAKGSQHPMASCLQRVWQERIFLDFSNQRWARGMSTTKPNGALKASFKDAPAVPGSEMTRTALLTAGSLILHCRNVQLETDRESKCVAGSFSYTINIQK